MHLCWGTLGETQLKAETEACDHSFTGIASVIQFWLNEEWATAEVHEQLGAAAGMEALPVLRSHRRRLVQAAGR